MGVIRAREFSTDLRVGHQVPLNWLLCAAWPGQAGGACSQIGAGLDTGEFR